MGRQKDASSTEATAFGFSTFAYSSSSVSKLPIHRIRLEVSIHYCLPETPSLRGGSFFFLEFLRFLILYSICFFFCLKSAGVLPQREKWKRYSIWFKTHRFLVYFFIANIIWNVVLTIWIIAILNEDTEALARIHLCKKPFFILLRIGGLVVSFAFCLMGYLINKRINNIPRTNDDGRKAYALQKRALRRLWLIIFPFLFVSIYLFGYDMAFLIVSPQNCGTLFTVRVI